MKKTLLSFLFFYSVICFGQDTASLSNMKTHVSSTAAGRQWMVGGLTVAGYGGSFIFLSTAWYKDHPRTTFHTYNDAGEWQQVDKAGHAWTAYHTSRITTSAWRWAGLEHKKAMLYGTGSSLLYMLSIEYLDGRSSGWGWSWADVSANFFGAALFAGQELGWKEQKIGLKFSSHIQSYIDPQLKERADDLYGRPFSERLLKDYNAQTYWLSANIKSFFPNTHLPQWLNISFGYGANNMFGGYENIAKRKADGVITFDRRDIPRYRQWYLAPDVDLTKIRTNSKFLRTAFSLLNVLKFPAPALEFSNGKVKFKPLVF